MQPDYVVVGAGTAGCLLAARLSESGAQVVLLEAGPPATHPMIHIPAGVRSMHRNPRVNWNYVTEPSPDIDGRQLDCPRGRVIGGSGSINGMLYVRGNAGDYDAWAAEGCPGWSYADVLPYFKKTECYWPGDATYRGKNGPMAVEDYRTILNLTHRFVRAARETGISFTEDYNGAQQEGVAYSQMTRRGRWRGSTAFAYLAPARARANLRVITRALVTRLLFEGTRCVGVALRRNGREEELRVAREVILCGGAINSPQLLQISGVGPAQHLRALGVPVVCDSPGVGRNLIDHYVGFVTARVKNEVSINQLARGWRLAREVLKFCLLGDGALTFGVTSATVFLRSHPQATRPDVQLLFTPASYSEARFGQLEKEPGITVAVCMAQPASRGEVMARSSDPAAPPRIAPNFLSDAKDLRAIVAGIRRVREIFAAPSMASCLVQELNPGPQARDDEAIAARVRATGGTIYHPVGTCRMGQDSAAVVDPSLRVIGVQGLRVADASVMPMISTGNTNAPTMMIAEKAADLIRATTQ